MRSSFIFIICFILFIYSHHTQAQSANLNGVVINTSPEYPIPSSAVVIKMETYQFDSDIADISWYYNSKLIDRGIGKKQIEIKYPSLGVTAEIRVVATIGGANGQNFTGGRILGGATVNLLYAPIDSYKPIWYAGATYPAEGGRVKMYAEAYLYSGGKSISPDNLIYSWNINEDPQPTISGLGKRSPIIDLDPIVGESYITVTVKSIDGLYETKASTRVIPVSPALHIYHNSSTVYPTHISYDYTMTNAESTLIAEPFNALVDKGMSYFWSVDGLLSTQSNKTFTVRRSERSRGQVNITTIYSNDKKLYQEGKYNGIIYFEKP